MNKILVPTDFSEVSENAVNYAIEMASFLSANLVLVHINPIPVSTPEFGIAAYDMTDVKNESLEALKSLANQIKANHPLISEVEYYAEMGNASDLIIEYSKDKDIDLVIMGISGHGSKLKKSLIGSTSVSVSKIIEIPLIIILTQSTKQLKTLLILAITMKK
jgi:nucleotide-binding universal stress UspA family protein